MKVISIKQPWASLIIEGYKEYEFRTWKTKYRGKILIHASKTIDKKSFDKFKDYNIKEYPLGKIIGESYITDCIEVNDEFKNDLIKKDKIVYGTINAGEYAFKLEKTKKLTSLIEINGKLGLWDFDFK